MRTNRALLVGKGLSNKAIAVALAISPRTVQKHLQRIYQHLGVQTRAGAIVRRHQDMMDRSGRELI